jgi:hypothetical protein
LVLLTSREDDRPVGARLAGEGVCKDAFAGKPGSYRNFDGQKKSPPSKAEGGDFFMAGARQVKP